MFLNVSYLIFCTAVLCYIIRALKVTVVSFVKFLITYLASKMLKDKIRKKNVGH